MTRQLIVGIVATGCLLVVRPSVAQAGGSGGAPVGFWRCGAGKASVGLAILPNGRLNFDGAAANYTVAGSTLRVMQQGQWVSYPYRLGGTPRARRLTITMPDRRSLACRPLGGRQEGQLRGMLCSWSGASNPLAGSSSSSSTRVAFDGRGNLSYAHEGGYSGPPGLHYGKSRTQRGFYRVIGSSIYLVFPDGSAGIAKVHMRQRDGRITEAKYRGTLYAAGLCK